MTDTQTTNTNWLEVESESLGSNTAYGEKLPALKFEEENKVYEITIDFSKPFNKYTDETTNPQKKVVKAIIPVVKEGIKCNWWLNVKNPSYKLVIDAGKTGQTVFKIMRTGSQANTKYVFVK